MTMNKQTSDTETVHHPKHYRSHGSGIECIDVVEHLTFCLGNALKYLWRLGHKGDALEDAKKALFYLKREMDFVTSLSNNLSAEEMGFIIGRGLSVKRAECERVIMKSEPNHPLRHVLAAMINTDRFYDENLLVAIEHLEKYIAAKETV